MGDAEELARERQAAQALLALIEQRLRDAQRKAAERSAELIRAIDESASIVGGGEFVELLGRSSAERNLR